MRSNFACVKIANFVQLFARYSSCNSNSIRRVLLSRFNCGSALCVLLLCLNFAGRAYFAFYFRAENRSKLQFSRRCWQSTRRATFARKSCNFQFAAFSPAAFVLKAAIFDPQLEKRLGLLFSYLAAAIFEPEPLRKSARRHSESTSCVGLANSHGTKARALRRTSFPSSRHIRATPQREHCESATRATSAEGCVLIAPVGPTRRKQKKN